MATKNISFKDRINTSLLVTHLAYMEQEIRFIKKLLNTNIYRVSVPNLFEKLELHKNHISLLEKRVISCSSDVEMFEKNNDIIGAKKNDGIDVTYEEEHQHMLEKYYSLEADFLEYKYKIFTYLESLLNEN